MSHEVSNCNIFQSPLHCLYGRYKYISQSTEKNKNWGVEVERKQGECQEYGKEQHAVKL